MRIASLVLALPLVGMSACAVPECGTGFTLGESGGCVIDRVASCGDGEVRNIAGECLAPYSTTNTVPDPDPDPDPETGLGGDTGDSDPVDTGGDTDTDTDIDTGLG